MCLDLINPEIYLFKGKENAPIFEILELWEGKWTRRFFLKFLGYYVIMVLFFELNLTELNRTKLSWTKINEHCEKKLIELNWNENKFNTIGPIKL